MRKQRCKAFGAAEKLHNDLMVNKVVKPCGIILMLMVSDGFVHGWEPAYIFIFTVMQKTVRLTPTCDNLGNMSHDSAAVILDLCLGSGSKP